MYAPAAPGDLRSDPVIESPGPVPYDILCRMAHQYHELISSHTADEVSIPEYISDILSHKLYGIIACAMSKRIIYRFEIIGIYHEKRMTVIKITQGGVNTAFLL